MLNIIDFIARTFKNNCDFSKAMFTQHQTRTIPNQTTMGQLLFTQDRSGTGRDWFQMDPKLDLQKSRSSFGSVPDRPVQDWIQSK